MDKNKKKITITVVSLLLLILLVVGVSYAAFKYAKEGTTVNKVSLATVTMLYTEGSNKISLENALPMEDEVGKKLSDPGQIFDFTVTINIKGQHNIAYEVTAEKDMNSTLTNDDVRIYLEKSTNPNGPYKEVSEPSGYIPMIQDDDFGAKTGEMRLDVGNTTTSVIYYYKLRMWLNKDYELTSTSKYFTIRVNVYGKDTSITYEEGISLDKTNATIKIGETVKLTETITPATANDKRVSWKTSNENIARVDSTGLVTGVGTGEAIVTVTTVNGKTASAKITVEKPEATGIKLNVNKVELITGKTTTVTATVEPPNAENKTLTWTSNNPRVATVDANGNITAVGAGTTKIVVKISNGISKEKMANTSEIIKEVDVTVRDSVSEGVILDKVTAEIVTGDITRLIATITPESSEDRILSWVSSDESIVTVNNGEITGVGVGTAQVTVTTVNGYSAVANIVVKNPEISDIVLSGNVTIKVGATHTPIITVTPPNARDKTIIWTSSNPSVAEVDQMGKITGVGEGEATIIATTVNGLTASLTITVKNIKTAVEILIDKANDSNMPSFNTFGDPKEMYVNNQPSTDQTPELVDYVYIGSTPNNYVEFNDELWRILGVFGVDDGSGIFKNSIKLVRNTGIEELPFDSDNKADWSKSSLMNLLNVGDYYTRTGKYKDYGLKKEAKEMIMPSIWYLGMLDLNPELDVYVRERSTRSNWKGNVGLVYASEYLELSSSSYEDDWFFVTDFASIDTRTTGGTITPTWTISIQNESTIPLILDTQRVIGCGGNVVCGAQNQNAVVKPAVYLNPSVGIIDGDGSIEKPYRFSMQY